MASIFKTAEEYKYLADETHKKNFQSARVTVDFNTEDRLELYFSLESLGQSRVFVDGYCDSKEGKDYLAKIDHELFDKYPELIQYDRDTILITGCIEYKESKLFLDRNFEMSDVFFEFSEEDIKDILDSDDFWEVLDVEFVPYE